MIWQIGYVLCAAAWIGTAVAGAYVHRPLDAPTIPLTPMTIDPTPPSRADRVRIAAGREPLPRKDPR